METHTREQMVARLSESEAAVVDAHFIAEVARLEEYSAVVIRGLAKAAGMKTSQTKGDLVTHLASHAAQDVGNRLRQHAADDAAKKRGFENAHEAYSFDKACEATARHIESLFRTREEFVEDAQKHGIVSAVKHAERELEQEISGVLAIEIAANANAMMLGGNYSNPYTAFQESRDYFLKQPLLDDTWRGGSTSQLSNAVEAVYRKVASSMLRWYF